MNILEELKATVIHHLKNDENVLREYNALLQKINKECVYNEVIYHVFSNLEIADKVGRCFKLQGFEVKLMPGEMLCVSGWDCELNMERHH